MAEYQITYWRELPSLVVAREGDVQAKTSSPRASRRRSTRPRCASATSRATTTSRAGTGRTGRRARVPPSELAAAVVARLEEEWSPEAIAAFLDGLG